MTLKQMITDSLRGYFKTEYLDGPTARAYEAGADMAFQLVLLKWRRHRYLSQPNRTLDEMLASKVEQRCVREELDAWAKEILDGDYK